MRSRSKLQETAWQRGRRSQLQLFPTHHPRDDRQALRRDTLWPRQPMTSMEPSRPTGSDSERLLCVQATSAPFEALQPPQRRRREQPS